MAASRSPVLAQLKKTFAAAHGCDERTARRHFARLSPEWQTFIAKQGQEAAKHLSAAAPSTPSQATALQIMGPASPADITKPPVADTPDDQLPEPARILKQQWRIYDHAAKAWQAAIIAGDELGAISLGLTTIKAQDAYYKALARHDRWELDERRKIPADEFHSFRARFILPLANSLRSLVAQLAPIMNPKDTPFAMRHGQEYMIATFNPQLQSLIDDLETRAPLQSAALAA
jgi:hypothetical protein